MTTTRVAGYPGGPLNWRVAITIAVFAAPAVVSAAMAQEPGSSTASPPASFAEIAAGTQRLSLPSFNEPAVAAPVRGDGDADLPTAPGIASSIFDTITESLFGDVYAERTWRPLSLDTFFSEGWNEAWAAPPAGSDGLTPRQGWLGALNGVFYRLWLTTFSDSSHLDTSYRGNRYVGLYQVFLPFSRRFEVRLDVPFVVSNGTQAPGRGYTSQFGDLTIVPRFLLSETAAATQVFALDIRTPTGTTATGNGTMSLAPRYEFWSNPGGPWVVRGGSGIVAPVNTSRGPSGTSYLGDLAVGRYFTLHDVPFGDLVFYVAANWTVPLDGTSKTATNVDVGPGTRFHITNNLFFLHDWQFPLTGPHPHTFTLQFALLKVF
jgi:hypothetical protein